MAEKFNRTRLQGAFVESMMRVNPKYIDFVHAELTRCVKIMAEHDIKCAVTPRITVSRKAQLQPVMFVKPNFIVINFPMINSMDQLAQNFHEVMTTCAMQMQYYQQQEAYKYVHDVTKVEKPKLHTFQSPDWQKALTWFTN